MNDNSKFDFEELMKQFDPTKMVQQFQEIIENSPFNQFNSTELMESQKNAAKSIAKANETVMSGVQALMTRQTEMMQQAMADAASAAENLTRSKGSEGSTEQSALIEAAMQKSMENFEEVADMIGNIYTDISEQVEQRMEQSVKELNDVIAKSKQ